MKLLQKFKEELSLLGVDGSSSVLLTISGGLDSMVLLDLCVKSGVKIQLAHVNYHLRGDDSNKDEKLVRDVALKLDLALEIEHYDLSNAKLNDGLQAEARKLRYAWFQSLCSEKNIDFIFTAHHLNDRIETFFINLLRGAGLKGLKSIPQSIDNIRRPLLKVSKVELQDYAIANEIKWRDDQSNFSDKYLRNKIRMGLSKAFGELSPRANSNASKALDFLTEADAYFSLKAKERIKIFESKAGIYEISDEDWQSLFQDKPLHKYVFEEFGFYPEQLSLLELFSEAQAGRKIEGRTHLVYRDRSKFLIRRIQESDHQVVHIFNPEGSMDEPFSMDWRIIKNVNPDDFKNPNLAYLDLTRLSFPLKLRPWQEGDAFRPFGMKGSKKVSDYLIDIKVPVPDKEKVYVLLSDDTIVWLIGFRIAEGYGVGKRTNSILRIEHRS